MPCLCWLNLRFGYTPLEDCSFLVLRGQIRVDNGLFLSIYSHLMVPLLGSFTEIVWFPACGNKQGVMIPPLCQFTDIKNIRITRLFVCARLIDQFTKIYDLLVGSIYRELWWNICHNLKGFYSPLAVLQMEDSRPGCTNIPREFCLSLKCICLIEVVSIYRYMVSLWFNLEDL